jgi:hypothetical protein
MALSELEQDQADFAARLLASPYFVDIGVYLLRPRANATATQIMQRIESALNCIVKKAGKGGAAVQVLMPLLQGKDPNVSNPSFASSLTVRVQEHPLFNMNATTGTLKSCECIALEVAKLLHHFRTGTGQIWTLAEGGGVVPNLEFDPKVTYDVTLTRLMVVARGPKLAMPTISPAPGFAPQEVTITAPTDAEEVWYSLNGSYPAPDAEGSVLYESPFTVAEAGALVRAVAYATDYQPSDVRAALFGRPNDFSNDFSDDFANEPQG